MSTAKTEKKGRSKGEGKASMSKTEARVGATPSHDTLRGNTAASRSEPQIRGDDVSGVENLARIREILFGAQMRDYEKRFSRLQERILKEVNELRDETRKRLDSVETYIKEEAESLSDRLKGEQENRSESVKDLSKELKDTAASFEKKLGKLDDHLSKTTRDLRQQILDQSKSLSDDIRQKYDDTSTLLERTAAELRDDKVDRSTLSQLLMEMSVRLTNDLAGKLDLELEDMDHE